MKYLIRIFTKDDENVMKEYCFDTLPYTPNIGETLTVGNTPYKILNIVSSFDSLELERNDRFMIDYTVEEIEW